MNDIINIGLIQTNIKENEAWRNGKTVRIDGKIDMEYMYEELVWQQILEAFSYFKQTNNIPDIIITPELTVPLPYKGKFISFCNKLGTIGIAGLDFIDDGKSVENKGILVIPQFWQPTSENKKRKSSYAQIYYFGKRYYAKPELDMFSNNGRREISNQAVYIIDGKVFGRIGLAICADIFDVQRWEIYRGRIHHFFIIAYNKDTDTFINFAHTIARTVYCNVAICNAGEFGNTIIVSPYKEGYKRVSFNEVGQNIKNYQIIPIPVAELDNAQKSSNKAFKTQPPGYEQRSIYAPNPQIQQLELKI
ncbi:MAG TPA: hypothetical protein VHP54_02040 [Caproiciproducens sp.]|nr:hypothetical protein [Caproiciproducens sp.]